MSDRLRFHKRAISELRDAVVWYDDQEPGLGGRFWDELMDVLDRVAARKLPGVNVPSR